MEVVTCDICGGRKGAYLGGFVIKCTGCKGSGTKFSDTFADKDTVGDTVSDAVPGTVPVIVKRGRKAKVLVTESESNV